MSEDTKRKPGQLGNDELEYIYTHAKDMTAEQIAGNLHRSVDLIKKKIAQIPKRLAIAEQVGDVAQLEASPIWIEVKKSLMPSEYDYFKQLWVSYIKQFSSGSDVLATDEMMIKDLIMMDIMGGRASSDIVDVKVLVEQLNKRLDKEREKSLDVRDQVSMQSWQEQINSLRGSLKSLTETHLSYQQRKDAKLNDLKATRRARFAEDRESKQTFFGLLRELNEYKNRLREGRLAGKLLAAAQKNQQDLNELTTYEDDTIDSPFLCPEMILEEDKNNKNSQEIDNTSDDGV